MSPVKPVLFQNGAFGTQALPNMGVPANGGGGGDPVIPIAYALKAHRIADFTYPNNSAWHVLPMDVEVEDESPGGVEFTSSAFETLEFTQAGLWYVSGCVRPIFTGVGNPSITSASRIIISNDDGTTWVEARCLQSVFGRSPGESEVDTQRYSGTIRAAVGTLARLQVRTSNTSLILRGWPTFDNPVSASIELHLIGE